MKAVTFFNARYLPLKEGLDQVGGTVDWDNAAKRATVHANGKTILVTMGELSVEANGAQLSLTQPPLIEGGHLYVPEEFFPNVVGRSVTVES